MFELVSKKGRVAWLIDRGACGGFGSLFTNDQFHRALVDYDYVVVLVRIQRQDVKVDARRVRMMVFRSSDVTQYIDSDDQRGRKDVGDRSIITYDTFESWISCDRGQINHNGIYVGTCFYDTADIDDIENINITIQFPNGVRSSCRVSQAQDL